MTHSTRYLSTPIGVLAICADETALLSIHFVEPPQAQPSTANAALLNEACAQLSAYFTGKLTQFDLPLHACGTVFQQTVWSALQTIPYGETCCYGDIAHSIHNPKSVRAVGMANSKNPLSIVVPCHRVIGRNGQLTGYAGGLSRKAWLLAHEKQHAQPDLF